MRFSMPGGADARARPGLNGPARPSRCAEAGERLEAIWYGRHPAGLMLLPLGWLFRFGVALRRLFFRLRLRRATRVPCPVIVVGNISVGGTGKTPLVIWLSRYLGRDFRPGVVCRGHGGRSRSWPQKVRGDSDPAVVGDEAVMLAKRTGCPVAAGPDRVASAEALIEHDQCDLILSDDGLQHLSLARDIEIAVVDGARRHGNGRCLPAGPLREPPSRLKSVDIVVSNGSAGRGEFRMRISPWKAINLSGEEEPRELSTFGGRPVHAVCAIGNPSRFLDMLREAQLSVVPHVFPDHHVFSRPEIEFGDALPVLMTEKDAVKCRRFAGAHHWYVPVRAELDQSFAVRLGVLLARTGAVPQ